MQSTFLRVTLLIIFLGLVGNASAFERKPEWTQYARPGTYDSLVANDSNPAKWKVVTELDRISYSIGMSIGADIKSRGIPINPNLVARGIQDTLSGEETVLSQQEATQILAKLQAQIAARQREEFARTASKNQQEGEAFLAQNALREGVIVTDSGLQYEILNAGTGATPTAEDIVVVDYRGDFIDGKEFDSSYKRGEPIEFSVKGIIPGWTEALLMMPEGAKWRIFIPADLAYGLQGAPPVIEPNTTLVFEVELKSIQK